MALPPLLAIDDLALFKISLDRADSYLRDTLTGDGLPGPKSGPPQDLLRKPLPAFANTSWCAFEIMTNRSADRLVRGIGQGS